jgi:hypothetical protein
LEQSRRAWSRAAGLGAA